MDLNKSIFKEYKPKTMASNKRGFPYEIKDLDPKQSEELMTYFKGDHSGYVRVGPKGYIFPKRYEEQAESLYNMPVRSDDVFVVTFPRSGTTWTQELVWLVANNLDYKKAAETHLIKRFPFIEFSILFDKVTVKNIEEQNKDNEEVLKTIREISAPIVDLVSQMPSPRFIKSHLPLSLLPPDLLDTAKVIFVARDPRDVAVSFYHHNRLIKMHGYVGDFKRYWNYFINDLIYYTPFWEYLKEGWEQRNHPNMLFLFYEELKKDLPGSIRRVAKFLDKQLTDDGQIEKLCKHLNIENFKNNPSVNEDAFKASGIINEGEEKFIRAGKISGWRSYFDEEMTRQAENWIAENLRDTDLRFPKV